MHYDIVEWKFQNFHGKSAQNHMGYVFGHPPRTLPYPLDGRMVPTTDWRRPPKTSDGPSMNEKKNVER